MSIVAKIIKNVFGIPPVCSAVIAAADHQKGWGEETSFLLK